MTFDEAITLIPKGCLWELEKWEFGEDDGPSYHMKIWKPNDGTRVRRSIGWGVAVTPGRAIAMAAAEAIVKMAKVAKG